MLRANQNVLGYRIKNIPHPDRWGKKEGGKKKRADRSLIKKELAVTYSSAA